MAVEFCKLAQNRANFRSGARVENFLYIPSAYDQNQKCPTPLQGIMRKGVHVKSEWVCGRRAGVGFFFFLLQKQNKNKIARFAREKMLLKCEKNCLGSVTYRDTSSTSGNRAKNTTRCAKCQLRVRRHARRLRFNRSELPEDFYRTSRYFDTNQQRTIEAKTIFCCYLPNEFGPECFSRICWGIFGFGHMRSGIGRDFRSQLPL